jgi:hypothetical protein
MAPLKLDYCHDKNGKVNDRHLRFLPGSKQIARGGNT